jgi:hypothetical protein
MTSTARQPFSSTAGEIEQFDGLHVQLAQVPHGAGNANLDVDVAHQRIARLRQLAGQLCRQGIDRASSSDRSGNQAVQFGRECGVAGRLRASGQNHRRLCGLSRNGHRDFFGSADGLAEPVPGQDEPGQFGQSQMDIDPLPGKDRPDLFEQVGQPTAGDLPLQLWAQLSATPNGFRHPRQPFQLLKELVEQVSGAIAGLLRGDETQAIRPHRGGSEVVVRANPQDRDVAGGGIRVDRQGIALAEQPADQPTLSRVAVADHAVPDNPILEHLLGALVDQAESFDVLTFGGEPAGIHWTYPANIGQVLDDRF